MNKRGIGKMASAKGKGTEPVYEVVCPGVASTIKIKPLAPRLKTLEGKTIGELWNHVFSGDITFAALEEGLANRYPGVKFVRHPELGRTYGPNEQAERAAMAALPEKLKNRGCDAVISGNGG
jgi:hypothetical protein